MWGLLGPGSPCGDGNFVSGCRWGPPPGVGRCASPWEGWHTLEFGGSWSPQLSDHASCLGIGVGVSWQHGGFIIPSPSVGSSPVDRLQPRHPWDYQKWKVWLFPFFRHMEPGASARLMLLLVAGSMCEEPICYSIARAGLRGPLLRHCIRLHFLLLQQWWTRTVVSVLQDFICIKTYLMSCD